MGLFLTRCLLSFPRLDIPPPNVRTILPPHLPPRLPSHSRLIFRSTDPIRSVPSRPVPITSRPITSPLPSRLPAHPNPPRSIPPTPFDAKVHSTRRPHSLHQAQLVPDRLEQPIDPQIDLATDHHRPPVAFPRHRVERLHRHAVDLVVDGQGGDVFACTEEDVDEFVGGDLREASAGLVEFASRRIRSRPRGHPRWPVGEAGAVRRIMQHTSSRIITSQLWTNTISSVVEKQNPPAHSCRFGE